MKSKLSMTFQDWIFFVKFSLKTLVLLTGSAILLWQFHWNQENMKSTEGLMISNEKMKLRQETVNPILAICQRNWEFTVSLFQAIP